MNVSNFDFNVLTSFSSKDPERPKLNSLYYDEAGCVVSTDSRRLFCTKNHFEMDKKGKAYDVHALLDGGDFTEIKEEFPKWRQAIPETFHHKFQLAVPEWFKAVEDCPDKVTFTLDYQDKNHPRLICGNFVYDRAIGFDARLLGPFSGKTVDVLIVDELTAMVLVPSASDLTEYETGLPQKLQELEWFALIMPLKMDETPNTRQIKRPEQMFV